jgi:hypothetical protein
VVVVFYDDGSLEGTIGHIQSLNRVLGVFTADPADSLVDVVADADASAVESLARLEGVLWVGYQSPYPSWGDEMASSVVGGNYAAGAPLTGYPPGSTASVLTARPSSGRSTTPGSISITATSYRSALTATRAATR